MGRRELIVFAEPTAQTSTSLRVRISLVHHSTPKEKHCRIPSIDIETLDTFAKSFSHPQRAMKTHSLWGCEETTWTALVHTPVSTK